MSLQWMLLMANILISVVSLVDISFLNYPNVQLPNSYDIREKWGSVCQSITQVQNQQSCHSCWAIASTGAITDRICIRSNGSTTPIVSVKNILSECKSCYNTSGCDGGSTEMVYDFWVKNGIKFENSNFRSYGSLYYVVDAKFVADIVQIMKLDLLTYGPFTVTFIVYEDFLSYKSGIYKHMHGNKLFAHSVEIMGYGKDYWIGKNSWGLDFGENGFFKIAMGTNECNIESQFYAGFSKIN